MSATDKAASPAAGVGGSGHTASQRSMKMLAHVLDAHIYQLSQEMPDDESRDGKLDGLEAWRDDILAACNAHASLLAEVAGLRAALVILVRNAEPMRWDVADYAKWPEIAALAGKGGAGPEADASAVLYQADADAGAVARGGA